MKTEIFLTINDGRIEAIYSDELADLMAEGDATIRRASEVEPTLGNRWTADLAKSGGPKLGPFNTRAEALKAEFLWLEQELSR